MMPDASGLGTPDIDPVRAIDDGPRLRPEGGPIGTIKNHRLQWLFGVLACVVLGAIAWVALMPVETDSNERVYVIPKGTFARRMAGEKFEPLPSEIHLTVGVKDVLVLRNEDDV